MDAPRNLRPLLLVAAALLLSVPAFAGLTVNGLGTVTVNLTGSTLSGAVTVGSSGDKLNFSIGAPVYDAGVPAWLRAEADGSTTPANLFLTVVRVPVGSGPFNATVTLTGSDSSSATVTVTFSPGGGTGPSPLGVSPNPVGLQLTGAGQTQTPLTVSSTSVTATTFSVSTTVTTSGLALSATPPSASVVAGSPVELTLKVAVTSSTAATYSGTVRIIPAGLGEIDVPVTVTVGGCGTGALTLTYGGQSCSNVALPIVYSSDEAVPAEVNLPMQYSGTATQYQVQTLNTSSGGSWLLADRSPTVGTIADISSGLIVSLASDQVANLATGTYTGTIIILSYPDLAASATVNVTLKVNGGGSTLLGVLPDSWTTTAAQGSGAQSQNFVLTIGSGVTVGTVTDDANWLSVTQPDTSGTFTATVDPSGLTTGVYFGNIQIPYYGFLQLTVPVILTIGSEGGDGGGGGTGTQVVAPTSLSFAYQVGTGGIPPVMPQIVFIPGKLNDEFSFTAQPSWITVNPLSAALPAQVEVRVNPGGLAAQKEPYTGSITINTPNGTTSVPVSLLVTNDPVLVINPGSFFFDGVNMGSQSTLVTASDGSAVTVAATAGLNSAFITSAAITPDPANRGTKLTVSASTSGLQDGTYSGTVQVTAAGMANSPVSFPVVLAVGGGGSGEGGSLTLSSSALVFNAGVNGTASNQTLSVASGSAAAVFSASSSVSSGNWLAISPSGSGLSTPQDITVSVNPSGLPVGTYGGKIVLSAGGGTQEVPVSLVISAGSVGGNVNLDKTSLNFTWQTGSAAPAAQPVQVTSASGAAQIPFSVSSSAAWLKAASASSTTAATVQVSIVTTGLTPNTYTGTITVAPTGGTQKTVSVTLTVSAPAISVDTTPLTYLYRPGDAKPADKTVKVSGGSNASFTASATATSGNWLAVSPASGTANPANLAVSVDPSGLSAGTYNGTVVVNGTNGSSGSFTVNVTLTVMAPLPTITQFGNAASYYAGALAPGEIVSLFGKDLGPTAPAGPIVQNGFLATTVAGVQVFVSGYPAPLTYVSGGQINAVVPYEVGKLKTASVWVKFLGQTSNTMTLPVTAAAPGIFTFDGTGSGQGAILNADNNTNNGPNAPAARGKYVLVYMTGEGETSPAGATGKLTVAQPTPPLTPGPLAPVAVLIDGIPVTPYFMGEAPTFVSGLMQLNLQIPQGARSGDVPVQISVGSYTSNTVTVRVQ
ncbi:MAG: hypothetical protein LAQ30_19075 [Acidobacteriia bacterium]|nr:hypothetical protein [Terriglobia bacterium]